MGTIQDVASHQDVPLQSAFQRIYPILPAFLERSTHVIGTLFGDNYATRIVHVRKRSHATRQSRFDEHGYAQTAIIAVGDRPAQPGARGT